MSSAPAPTRPSLLSWRPRVTARARLTLVFTSMLLGCGLLMMGALYAVMKYVPTYAITSAITPGTFQQGDGHMTQLEPPATSAPASPGSGSNGNVVVRSVHDLLAVLLESSGAILAVVVLVGGLISWVVAGRLLRPVHEITVAARRAAEGSLDHRVGLTGPRDEFSELSDTFDSMLARLERSFSEYERFAANASHELKTPLATTQALLSLAADSPDSTDTRLLIAQLQETTARSVDTVTALLELAEAAHGELQREEVDLGKLVAESTLALSSEARTHGVYIENDCPLGYVVEVNRILFARLVDNVLTNAVRHNIDGGRVAVELIRQDDLVRLIIVNTGVHLGSEELEKITEPFYRGAGRVRVPGRVRGNGLGLALACNIARAHGAQLEVRANPDGGLILELALPMVAPSAPLALARAHDLVEK
ncbi:two-component system sensor histidine kinase VanS [Mycetocola sp. BIGb0189]|uniref:sensor histidine kinase n=1 Tax=Mycetocola sp. BIGb0189 TaxID=2940604 RepID=UPI002168F120|nr:HAMP domain-containing sensor histidine kinase [Mycetocola sp. BIGb0189]MCS4275655.1 two-component system sensor histidine kinase VanS [Mycetocola sp. BIGb0189]